jgi:hypothetical protein
MIVKKLILCCGVIALAEPAYHVKLELVSEAGEEFGGENARGSVNDVKPE